METERTAQIRELLKGGRKGDKYAAYKEAYESISKKKLNMGCSSCAVKFLYNWLSNWLNYAEKQ